MEVLRFYSAQPFRNEVSETSSKILGRVHLQPLAKLNKLTPIIRQFTSSFLCHNMQFDINWFFGMQIMWFVSFTAGFVIYMMRRSAEMMGGRGRKGGGLFGGVMESTAKLINSSDIGVRFKLVFRNILFLLLGNWEFAMIQLAWVLLVQVMK